MLGGGGGAILNWKVWGLEMKLPQEGSWLSCKIWSKCVQWCGNARRTKRRNKQTKGRSLFFIYYIYTRALHWIWQFCGGPCFDAVGTSYFRWLLSFPHKTFMFLLCSINAIVTLQHEVLYYRYCDPAFDSCSRSQGFDWFKGLRFFIKFLPILRL
jgi:hypothetical protein